MPNEASKQEAMQEEELLLFSKSPVIGAKLIEIGKSATNQLVFVGQAIDSEKEQYKGVCVRGLIFSEPGSYGAWWVDSPTYFSKTPEGYRRFMSCEKWLRIYDDTNAINFEGNDQTWFDLYQNKKGQVLIIARKYSEKDGETD